MIVKAESDNLWYSTDNVKARQIADRWLNMRRYHTHGVSRYEAIPFTSFEDREPHVERVLKHRMVVLLMIGAAIPPFAPKTAQHARKLPIERKK